MRLKLWAALAVLMLVFGTVAEAQQVLVNSTITTAGSNCSTATACVVIPPEKLRNVPSVSLRLDVGTSGTFHAEFTLDGVLWEPLADDVTGDDEFTADSSLFFTNPGYRSIRIRASAISGAAGVLVLQGAAGLRSTASVSGVELGEVEVGAQPATDPHFVRCSDSTGAAPCEVEITNEPVVALSAVDNAVLDSIADGIEVSGTVTAELSAVDNAVLDAIAADTAFIETMKAPLAPDTATATAALVIGGTYNATPPTFTDGEQGGVQLDAEGNLLVASPDILSELSSIDASLSNIDNRLSEDVAFANAVNNTGPQVMVEAKTIDNATLPNVVAEGQAGRLAGTVWGGAYSVRSSLDGLYAARVDPCESEEKTTTPISITADAVIISATASKKNYICSIVIGAGASEIVAITEGTGSVCGTSEAALVGSTTDANGMPFGAGGGASIVGGSATVIAGKTANVDTCLTVSGSERVAGFVTWVQR